jgi:membrane protein
VIKRPLAVPSPASMLAPWITLLRDWLQRFVAVQGIDRAMAIAAQSFSAFLPLLIVYASILPRSDNKSFADLLVERFELTGPAARSIEQAFAPVGTVQSSVTVVGLLLLLVSTLSFTRGLQRLYELSFGLKGLGVRNTLRALFWLAWVGLFFTLRPLCTEPFHGWLKVAVTITLSTALWLLTPYLLLGRRVRWQRLLPSAILSAIGMTGVAVWSVIWMPHTFATSAAQFGVIGVGFAMLTWFVAVAAVIVVTTTGGATIADRWIRP